MEADVPQVYLLGKTYLTNNEKFYIRNDSIVYMAVGDRHSIIVTESGRAYAFGDNNSGQLGLGHTNAVERISCIKSLKVNQTKEKIILAACGRDSSLVATNDGSLYAFGLNDCCQLGMKSEESIPNHSSPIKIESFPSKMSWKQLAMGAQHTCVLTNDGQVYVWGSNEVSQCGLEFGGQMIRTPKKLRLDYSVQAIACGYYHTALISADGRLLLFGDNSDRQLGRSVPDQCKGPLEVSLPDPVQSVACGIRHTVVLTVEGDVYTCGRGDRGQLGLGRKVSIAKHFQMIKNLSNHLAAIAAGATHTAIVDSNGEVYLFGDGKHGKLNYRTCSNKSKPHLLDQFKGYHVSKVLCGGCLTIILAQKKFSENSNMEPTKSIAGINHAESADETSKKRSFSSHAEAISNPHEVSAAIKRASLKVTRVEANGKLKRNLSSPDKKFEPLSTRVLHRTVSFKDTTTDLTTSDDCLLSIDQSPVNQRRSDHPNRLKAKPSSDDERSLSQERSVEISEESTGKKPSVNRDGCQSPASTTSGRTSSSISSLQDDNLPVTPESTDAIEHSSYSLETGTHGKPYLIDSEDASITTKSEGGLFSRIRNGNLSRKPSMTTNANSKICSVM